MFVSKYIKGMFASIPKEWGVVLAGGKMKPEFAAAMKQLQKELASKGIKPEHIERDGIDMYIRPSHENVFEAFRHFQPSELKVVIVGQDPYLKPEEATGIAFSVPHGAKIPPSLANIYKCWVQHKYIHTFPKHGNLENLSKQGVLLINRYLTRSPDVETDEHGDLRVAGNGSSKRLHTFWGEYTKSLIRLLTSKEFQRKHNLSERVFVMLWGDKARPLADVVGENGVAVFWRHPSPLANRVKDDGHFQYCDNFGKANEEHKIVWNPDYDVDNKHLSEGDANLVVAYTDGSCVGNGKDKATAGYAAYFGRRLGDELSRVVKEDKVVYGRLEGKEVRLSKSLEVEKTSVAAKVTNQRAELFAVIAGLDVALKSMKNRGSLPAPRVVVVSDSEYAIRIVTKMIWEKRAADKQLRNVNANRDMVVVLYKQLMHIAKMYGISWRSDDLPGELLGESSKAAWWRYFEKKEKTPPEIDLSWGKLAVTHQKSHKAFASGDKVAMDKWKGNNIADEYANKGREGGSERVEEVI
jgi:uracil-DNA glycosylase